MVVTTKTLEGIMPVGSKMGAKQMATAIHKRCEMQSQLHYDVQSLQTS